MSPSRATLTAFHCARLERDRLGPAAVARLLGRVVGGQAGPIAAAGRDPVDLDALGLEQEGHPIDRRVHHDLAGLVEELVVDRVAVAERALIVEPALVGLGARAVGIVSDVTPGCGAGEDATAVNHAVLGRPVVIVELDRFLGLLGLSPWSSTRRSKVTEPRQADAR